MAYALVVNLNALFSHFILQAGYKGINESVWSLVRLMRTYYGSEQCISMVAGPHCANWAGIVNFHRDSRGDCPRSPLLPTGHQWLTNWVPFSCHCSHSQRPPPSKPCTICRKVKVARLVRAKKIAQKLQLWSNVPYLLQRKTKKLSNTKKGTKLSESKNILLALRLDKVVVVFLFFWKRTCHVHSQSQQTPLIHHRYIRYNAQNQRHSCTDWNFSHLPLFKRQSSWRKLQCKIISRANPANNLTKA